MKKFLGLAVVIALLSFVSVSYASVAVNEKILDVSTYVGEATNLEIEGQDVSFDGSRATILANGHKDGVTDNVSGESDLLAAAVAYGIIKLADVGSLDSGDERFISLANGTAGQMLTIILIADSGGTLYITDDKVASGTMTNTGWDDIAFDSALDSVTLLWVDDTTGWIIVGMNAVTVT